MNKSNISKKYKKVAEKNAFKNRKNDNSASATYARRELQQLLIEKRIAYVDANNIIRTCKAVHPDFDEILDFIANNEFLFHGELYGKEPIIQVVSESEVVTSLSEMEMIEGSGNVIADETQTANRTINLLTKAVNDGISDIHIRLTDRTSFMGRKDGRIQNIMMPQDRSYGMNMLSYLFMRLSRKQWNEKGDFDGRFTINIEKKGVGNVPISWRISQIPSTLGPKVTIRNLDSGNLSSDLTSLGLTFGQANKFNELMRSEHGLLLISGPTGSGKTTTINTALDSVAESEDKIIQTLEDPPEWFSKRNNIIQTEISPDVRVSDSSDEFKDFAYYGKKILRGDTDIVMVGEVRDRAVAMISLRMGGTGQLCISTTHNNSAIASVSTYIEQFGVSPALVASPDVLRGLAHQRLVRKVCPHCSFTHEQAQDFANKKMDQYEYACERAEYYTKQVAKSDDEFEKLKSKIRYKNNTGCNHCFEGESGRTALFELVVIGDEDRHFIANNDINGWEKYLKEIGCPTIYDHAAVKVATGICDVSSIESVLTDLIPESASEVYAKMHDIVEVN